MRIHVVHVSCCLYVSFMSCCLLCFCFFFFFNDTATTEIYTLSLHDALPISLVPDLKPALERRLRRPVSPAEERKLIDVVRRTLDRKSTRLNSSHTVISYAVFCLKKKKKKYNKSPLTTFASEIHSHDQR